MEQKEFVVFLRERKQGAGQGHAVTPVAIGTPIAKGKISMGGGGWSSVAGNDKPRGPPISSNFRKFDG